MKTGSRPVLIGAHLDLKGVQPREAYLKTYLRDLKRLGFNTLLVEYEDVFPFASMPDIADAPDAVWSLERLNRFRRAASETGIEIIPLQQTLGHLEYIFRWEKYAGFTQNRQTSDTLKLSNKQGRRIVIGMLREVIEAHPESRYIHLGMDEAGPMKESGLVKRQGGVFPLFLAYLGELCDIVEEYGKTPIIWSDMIEDHYMPGSALDAFRDRVILMVWDYCASPQKTAWARIHGQRVSRAWLNKPDHPDAPRITNHTAFVEDLPKRIRDDISSYCRDGFWKSLWQVDFFSQLGFRVIGAGAVRKSADGPVLPDYGKMFDHIDAWKDAVIRNNQLGLVLTSWERGCTFWPPNYNIDLQWPGLEYLGQSLDPRVTSRWAGIAPDQLRGLLVMISRCRQGWRLEETALDRMTELKKNISPSHRSEWLSLSLMLEVSALGKEMDAHETEMTCVSAGCRLPAAQLKSLMNRQGKVAGKLAGLRARVKRHFRKRYTGAALEEWIRRLFDVHAARLEIGEKECRKNLPHIGKHYARSSSSRFTNINEARER